MEELDTEKLSPLLQLKYRALNDAFAELAWEEAKIVILAGDQKGFADKWQQQGWKVILPDDIEARGTQWLVDTLTSADNKTSEGDK